MNRKVLFVLLLAVVMTQVAFATPKFMTLPFNQDNVVLQQGWYYTAGGTHRGIDWQRNWQTFNVYSSHDGEATYFGGCGSGNPNCNGGLGNYVRIKKNIGGTDYYTLYCHLASSPLPQGSSTNVLGGQSIGVTGVTGAANGVNHLHFEYHEGSIGTKKDPYDIYSTAANYPPNGGSCGPNYSWTSCPPIFATYSCSWHTQDPNTIVTMNPGQTRTFTVSYRNTGNTTWQNTGGVSNPNYIELRSCDANGNVTNSWLYPGSGWINAQRVVAPNAANVQPTQNAWFIFTGKVPNNATPGDYHIYFRPYHATGGYIQNWGGMNFYIRVVNLPPTGPDPKADIAILYDYGSCQTRAHMLLSNGSNFIYQGDNGWRIQNDYCLQYVVRSLSGDFNGDGLSDLAMLYQYGQCNVGIHMLLSTGSSFTYQAWWWQSDGYCVYAIKGAAAGDFNGDGKDDIAFVYNYGNCETRVHVLLSTGSSFVYQGNEGWWRASGWYCAEAVRFMNAGDLNADGKDDLIMAYRYGPASTALHVFLSTGSSFNYSTFWFWADGWFSLDAMKFMETGDLNADGKADVVMACRYGPGETALLAFLSTGSGFNYQGWWWHVNYYSLDAVKYMQAGDITGDGKADVAMSYRYGQYSSAVHCFVSTGNTFSYQPYWWQSDGYGWDYTNGFVLGRFNASGSGYLKFASEAGEIPLPKEFVLNQNYPNPFNPATTISYTLPEASQVLLEVYNILGQKIAILINERQTAGEHQAVFDGSAYASGIYFYRLSAGSFAQSKKMLLIK